MKPFLFSLHLFFLLLLSGFHATHAQHQQALLNEPVDLSPNFQDYLNTYFLADSLVSFDPETGQGQCH
jgi:alpha-D-xyloside xylohydrolase